MSSQMSCKNNIIIKVDKYVINFGNYLGSDRVVSHDGRGGGGQAGQLSGLLICVLD